MSSPFLRPHLIVALALGFAGCIGQGELPDQQNDGGGRTGGAGGQVVALGGAGGAGGDGGAGGAPVVPPEPYCGDGHLDENESCDDGNQNPFDGCLPDCRPVAPIEADPLTWTYVEVPGTQCLDGSPAGFGISINPDSPNLMIYLEGGGACFNDACDFSALSIPFVPPPDGIFNRDNSGNPVRDWSMVYVPYCTGDIHGGDNDYELAGQVRHFHGYTNITKYLQQWVPTFAHADNVLVTGISAGGFGAGLNFAQVTDAFSSVATELGDTTPPQMILIDDSGPPLTNQVIPPCLQITFRKVWGLDNTVLAECGADCPDWNDFAAGFIEHVSNRYPNARVGVFSNTADMVIRSFMGFGWEDGQYNHCTGTPSPVPASVYEDGLLALRDTYETRASSYLLFGIGHTVLRSPTFYATVVDGVSVEDWVGAVINGEIQHVGP
ncbi:MAG: pectin acetylesterase-family hydrolase [Polyangiaceae bacterium]